MIRGHITGKLRHLVLSGAIAALLALGAAGAGVQGDPSQWGLTGPTTTRDPQASRRTTTEEPMSALNFPKITYSALNFTKIQS